jgi:hypothetical protein
MVAQAVAVAILMAQQTLVHLRKLAQQVELDMEIVVLVKLAVAVMVAVVVVVLGLLEIHLLVFKLAVLAVVGVLHQLLVLQ